ncbi:MAG: deoxyribodipyrimidine photo-lyase [Roseovarius sp.]
MRNTDPLQIVWFKRDLRPQDHRPLARAATAGRVLPLYVVEPGYWAEPDVSGRHWAFLVEALRELREDLAALGQPLVVRMGEIEAVLEEIALSHPIAALWSHEETGNDWTFRRDKRVAAWCAARSIPWHDLPQHGVHRRLVTRTGWAAKWDRFMAEPLTPAPRLAPIEVAPGALPEAKAPGLPEDPCPERQTGGRAAALERLESFLTERGKPYRRAMSNPLEGATACSRLSPHLALGTLSMREVAQATWARQRALKAARQTAETKAWRGAMSSFSGRLHWHCHFMQKLEDEPRLEFENLHPAYDGLRPLEPDAQRLEAWQNGETGLPFLDACMRCLRHTGWLNFRMRAMVMASASYHLWLDWRAPGLHLARMFTDYEPGIHWPQVQMQSGTTGINTVRIYNPVKQGHDQDPTGAFTRRWVPELSEIADAHLQEPWKAENAGAVLGKVYPFPVVDHLEAAREARDKIWAVRRGASFRDTANAIQSKHGSRKSGVPNRGRTGKRPSRKAPATQGHLPLWGDDA